MLVSFDTQVSDSNFEQFQRQIENVVEFQVSDLLNKAKVASIYCFKNII